MNRLALLAALLLPATAVAQPVAVMGGEHGDFTRLVLYLPEEVEWRLAPAEDGRPSHYTLVLGREDWVIDISRAFDRIGRDRVASLEAGPGRLAMEIACACSLSAFRADASLLVVDIAPDEAGTTEVPPAPSARAAAGLDLSGMTARTASSLAPLLPRFEPPDDLDTALVAGFAATVAADIGQAVASGMLDRSPAATPSPGRPAEHGGLPGRPLAPIPAGTDDIEIGDRDGTVTLGGRTCVPDRDLKIEAWAAGGSILDLLGESRGSLFAEFDRVDEAAVRDHAQHLLHFGFGVEARAVLGLSHGDEGTLNALSYILDGESDPSGTFAGQASCPGSAALWSVLATEAAQVGSVDANAVLRTFDSLPEHLKADLGERLSQRLVDLGETGAAAAVVRRVQRALGQSTPGLDLVLSRLDLQSGQTEEAAERLESIIEQPAAEVTQAIVAAVEIAEAGQTPVPERLAEMAEAMAAERRLDDTGPGLWRAHLLSLILNKDFTGAYAALARAEGIPPDMQDAVAERAVLAMAEEADTRTFLKLAFSDVTREQSARRPVAIALAARLLDLGLAEAARDALDRASGDGTDQRLALLAARAHLMLAEPRQAEILLIGSRDPEAERLRAEARSMMGDFARAATLHDAAGDTAAARQAAWLSGDWSRMADAEGDALARAAALVDATVDAAPAGASQDGLGAALRLAEQSAETRAILDDLLSGTRLEPD